MDRFHSFYRKCGYPVVDIFHNMYSKGNISLITGVTSCPLKPVIYHLYFLCKW